jgi:hypothetical protein
VLHRRVVRSAADTNHRNKQVAFKPYVQERISKLDSKPSTNTGNNHHKQKIREFYDVSNRTRSKVGHVDQRVGNKTRSKLQAIFNSTNKGAFFPLLDAITFKSKGNFKNIGMHLGLTYCRVYHYGA